MGPSRRVLLHGPRDVRLGEGTLPPPGPGEVRVRLLSALTGGTVRKVVARGGHARFGPPPLALGHEAAGTVEDVGPGVTRVRPGERVLVGDSAACGRCAACAAGRGELCPDMLWLTGFFADAWLVPARVVERNLHPLPAGLAPEVAALADNLASVLHGLERTPARPGTRARVLGAGPLGLLWCWALAQAGAEVTLAARTPPAAAAARAFGAPRVVAAGLPAEPAELVVEAVGSPEAWAQALAALAPGGTLNGFGGPPDGTHLALDARRLHYEELTLASSFHYRPAHLARALALLAGPGPWTHLLDPRPVRLADLPALLASDGGSTSRRKHIVVP